MRVWGPTPGNMNNDTKSELSSLEGTRGQFNGRSLAIKSAEGRIRPVCGLGIDVHQRMVRRVRSDGSLHTP